MGSVDMSVCKACGECAPLSVLCCTVLYCLLCTTTSRRPRSDDNGGEKPPQRTECGNNVREMIATAGMEHLLFSSFVPALTHQRASRL